MTDPHAAAQEPDDVTAGLPDDLVGSGPGHDCPTCAPSATQEARPNVEAPLIVWEYVFALERQRDEALAELAAARAETERLREALEIAYTDSPLQHLWNGQCPDGIEGFTVRDPECEACKHLTAALAAAPAVRQENQTT